MSDIFNATRGRRKNNLKIQWVLLNIPPRSSGLHPLTRKPIELSHLEGHLNSRIAPRGGEERGVSIGLFRASFPRILKGWS